MTRSLLLALLLLARTDDALADPVIIDRPIRFDAERVQLTLEYIQKHYGLTVRDVRIVPRAIVVHWTGGGINLEASWRGFNRVRMESQRRYLVRGGLLNVSAHFLVDRDGTIYRLLPETWMARHCIGLNFDSIGIENLGGDPRHPLTEAQLRANAALVRYLARRHPIRFLLGHLEWRKFENSPLFRERDATYRNAKADPGLRFMRLLRERVRDLGLAGSYPAPPRPSLTQPIQR
jgi:N-acetylmuramoyl-L-alanine amidase